MDTTTTKARPLLAWIAVIGWIAVLLQLHLSLRFAMESGKTVVQGLVAYFGFLTVLTNVLVCIAATWLLAMPRSTPGRFFAKPVVIGWVAASIAFVGIAYYVLLRHVWKPHGLQLTANVLLHYVTPILFVLYSLAALRGVALRWTSPLWWSIYLAVYFVYVLLRGAMIGSYPYGFIDVSILGYAVAVRNGCFLLVAFWVLSYVLMVVWRVSAKRSDPLDRN